MDGKVLIPILGGAGLAGGLLAYAVRSPSSSLLAPSVHRGDRSRRAIALTFDDGPSESTLEILALLGDYDVPATFFHCGANVRRLPAVARVVAAAGHEIGNHTDTHPRLYLRSEGFIHTDISRAQTTIEEVCGRVPRLFRAPYGARWFGLRAVQEKLGLLGVMWTVLGMDWKWPADRISSRLLAGAGNGAIFCLHDGRLIQANPDIRATVEALRQAIPALLARGFRFETVSQILCPAN